MTKKVLKYSLTHRNIYNNDNCRPCVRNYLLLLCTNTLSLNRINEGDKRMKLKRKDNAYNIHNKGFVPITSKV